MRIGHTVGENLKRGKQALGVELARGLSRFKKRFNATIVHSAPTYRLCKTSRNSVKYYNYQEYLCINICTCTSAASAQCGSAGSHCSESKPLFTAPRTLIAFEKFIAQVNLEIRSANVSTS